MTASSTIPRSSWTTWSCGDSSPTAAQRWSSPRAAGRPPPPPVIILEFQTDIPGISREDQRPGQEEQILSTDGPRTSRRLSLQI